MAIPSKEKTERVIRAATVAVESATQANAERFGKEPSVLMLAAVTAVLDASSAGRTPEEARDIIIAVFGIVDRLQRIIQTPGDDA